MIGINYDLVQAPKPKDVVKAVETPAKKPVQKPQAEPAKPKLLQFQVTIRCVATVDVEREVEAKTAKEAGELALGNLRNEGVDLSAGKLSHKVLHVHRVSKA